MLLEANRVGKCQVKVKVNEIVYDDVLGCSRVCCASPNLPEDGLLFVCLAEYPGLLFSLQCVPLFKGYHYPL